MIQCEGCGSSNAGNDEIVVSMIAMTNDILTGFIGQLLDFADKNWCHSQVEMLERSIDEVLQGNDTFSGNGEVADEDD